MKKIFYFVLAAALTTGGCKKETADDPTGSIYGVIVDADGEPVNAASIELGIGYTIVNEYKITALNKTVSGNDGRYEFKNIETDLSEYKPYGAEIYHYVEAAKQGFKTSRTYLKVEAGKITNGDIVLNK